ncbi:hypothetical protein X797_011667 [Metarhizium robertsii]|uniref:Epoxide hydrolase n=2 Tax=Metarhizium robertsii TaxID=568076 RepID=E9FDP2_METRA|nr:epoxide hydrolase [Metarhizium robertsii ARSEF 23]EFY94155.1 epoxide hydrolase [Metarhizium robertsii ARSEF 23]EXU95264.1 hypothetical protein X797_011667 [Metarhizium robertsii]
MQESLLSILCSETWHWDSEDASQISFNENGTGKLICRAELNVWIAAEFDWQPHDKQALSQMVDLAKRDGSPIDFQTKVNMTLTKRRIPSLGNADMSKYNINESLLAQAAFEPKTYTITLDQGTFFSPYDAQFPGAQTEFTPLFRLRLTFDTSPFPPRCEWQEPRGAPDALKFWEWKQFCGREIGKQQ